MCLQKTIGMFARSNASKVNGMFDKHPQIREFELRSPRFLIISEPRSGSNNLSYFLNSHPNLEVGNELFHQKNGIILKNYDYLGLNLENIIDNGHWIGRIDSHSRNLVAIEIFKKYNGFKVHTQHLKPLLVLDIIEQFECLIILLFRRNAFQQAASNFIAVHRNIWHANENRLVNYESFSINPHVFLDWIENLYGMRRAMWQQLLPVQERVLLCEYESLYSGSVDEKLQRFQQLFDFLGLERLGKLPPKARKLAYSKARKFLDDKSQKMVPLQIARDYIENYDDLVRKYQTWYMHSFGKSGII